ncbi:hypothetical protein [Zunongwangia sp. HGR-M22]|uniref:hypothetical protein n=1 Tax=Zunongwangia sp. HGR-M22 TaxID=3015168 RepID=UPI0022DCFA39|nr:hypothetical protein [Zunongwangia sp. HGR-M22]WBL26780.1 hypothetical protein PBT91_05830 [Zunongwangia sp. HGR-M22]
MNYDNEIKLAKEKDAIKSGDIFDFRETPFEDLCTDYYKFCRQHLNDNIEIYNIEPTVFVYTGFYDSNACAQYKNDAFSIQINVGLIKKCQDNYLQNKEFDEYLEKHHSDIIKHFDNPITGLAFQIATQFTYYHEFAHLIQFEKKRENISLQERFVETSTYDQVKQHMETNADTLASIAIASHIQQYIKKSFGDNISEENVELTIIILCSCLLNHIANFYEDLPNIYYKEHKHPHPFLRLFTVNLNIINYLNQSEFFKKMGIDININKVFKSVLDFYEELEKNKIFETKITETMTNASKQQKEIVQYMGDLIQYDVQDYNDAVEQWNKHFA